jgi:hypothetical protein
MMARIFLLITALMFLAFGLWSITDPAGMTSRLGVEIGGVSGLFEMRGIYGGVSLGAGIFCLLGALRAKLSFAALCFVATYMGGYMIGRVASLIAGDSAQPSSWMFAGYELVMGLIALALLLRHRSE